MVRIDAADGLVTFTVLGLHKLWALRSRIRIPARDIVDVAPGEPVVRAERPGLRLPGTYVPGLITAGSFLKTGGWTFWDVVRPERTILVTTKGHRYARLVVEVADPVAEIARLQQVAADHRTAPRDGSPSATTAEAELPG